ncbi:MAG: aldo/keto reductase, partial [Armatimonadetes bacterium]|nr:aldo/keto reductase [Armatimonadota bacterium]
MSPTPVGQDGANHPGHPIRRPGLRRPFRQGHGRGGDGPDSKGVNHFDCARCYGNSLGKLGRAVREGVVRRDEILVSGRLCCHSSAPWGYYGGDGPPDYTAARAVADIEDQLSLLGIGYFDVVFVHDPPEVGPTLAAGGCLEGLESLRDRGLIRFLGYGMRPHDAHLEVIASGRTQALLCFSDYNLLRQSAADRVLPAAAAADLGVLNGWSIMRGMLTGRPVEEVVARDRWLPQSDGERADRMRSWCRERGLNLLEMALHFCLAEGRIHGHPLGNLNLSQLEANVAAVLSPPPAGMLEEFVAQR